VVSESLFSMDGDIADVAALAALAKRLDASLVLDEAHALGVMGPEGRGVAAAAGVTPDLLIGTLGKALGSFGAFAATSAAVAQLLWNRARSLVFSTALPPMVAASANAAIEIVRGREGDRRRTSVASHARAVRAAMNGTSGTRDQHARVSGAAESPIAPIVIGDDAITMKVAAQILDAGIFAPGIRPPTVPVGTARIRLSLTADHQLQDLENACVMLNDAMRRFT
jgi:7-keto-8-aminopelargonate synthetase-like enzyme